MRTPVRQFRFLIGFFVAVTALAFYLSLRLQDQTQNVSHPELAELTADAVASPPELFAERLPQDTDSQRFLQDFQSLATRQGVSIESITNWAAVATAGKLGRSSFSVELKGKYPKVKAILAAELDGTPGLVIQNLSFRRGGQAPDVEAHVDFLLLTQPRSR